MRRTAEQEHAVLLTVDPDGTERVLVDPIAIDPTGATTLDAWQPSKEGDLLAYQLSAGGTEESVLRVMDVATGEPVDGPIDRARYSPVAWLPGGEAFYYVRRLRARARARRRGAVPPPGLAAPGRHRPRDRRRRSSATGWTRPTTTASRCRWTAAGWSIGASAGTAPRNDLWLADLSDGRLGVARPAGRAGGRRRQHRRCTSAATAGSTSSPTATRPAAGSCVTTPDDPAYEHWTDLVPEDDEAVLEGFAILDGPARTASADDGGTLLCAWTRHAVSEVTAHALRTGERTGTVPLPGLGSVTGLAERPEGGHEAWFGYTDHVTPASVYRYDAHTGRDLAVGDRARAPSRCPRCTPGRSSTPPPTAPTVRMLVLSPTKEPDRPRPTSSTATAASASR